MEWNFKQVVKINVRESAAFHLWNFFIFKKWSFISKTDCKNCECWPMCLLGLNLSQGWFVSLYLGRSSYASNQVSCFLKCCCRCQCHCVFPPHPTVSQLLIATTSSRQPMVSCAPPYFPIFISPVVWIHIWHEFVFLPWANCFYSARKRHIVRVMKREIFE